MATEAAIAAVRENTNEPTAETFSDERIGDYVDTLGSIEAASAAVWRRKAGIYSELVVVTEAGSTRKLSDLSKSASAMAASWDSKVPGAAAALVPHAKVHRIVRND